MTYGLTILTPIIQVFGAPSSFEDRDVSLEVVASLARTPAQYIVGKPINFQEPSRWHGILWGRDGNIQAGEGAIAGNGCPTEFLQKPFLEVRKALLTAIQKELTFPQFRGHLVKRLPPSLRPPQKLDR